jgi:hypothetical protein
MKQLTSIVSTLILGSALALSACGKKDTGKTEPNKPSEPAATAPAPAGDTAKPAEPAGEKPKEEGKAGGW